MKILFYQHSCKKNEVVSANVHIIEVLNNLTKLGHTVIYINGEHHLFTESSPTEVVVKLPPQKTYWEKIKKFIWALPFKGEALVLYYLFNEIKLFLVAFGTVWRCQPDLIYRRHTLFHGENLLCRIFKIPSITEVNGIISIESEIQEKGNAFSLWLINKIEKFNIKGADKYIVVSSMLKDVLYDQYHVQTNKTVVIENGANTELFKPIDMSVVKKELNLDLTKNYLCAVGLAIWHGVNYFISAMPLILKEYPNTRAIIVGEGSLKSKLVGLSHQLDISDKVIFTGKVPYESVPWYINASEVCVLASIMEGKLEKIGLSPLKMCEYLACGKPVVASRIKSFEFIEKNDCGYLVSQGAHVELAQAIIKLLRDPVNRQRMSDNGRKYVLENRSWESVAKKVAAVFENVIKEKKGECPDERHRQV